MSIFQLWGNFDLLQRLTNFWCLMFVVLASGVALCYFALGWSATTLSFVSACPSTLDWSVWLVMVVLIC